jgi:predicted TIM-barrel enzyme
LIESDAGSLLRYRTAIGADRIRVFADIKKKHSSDALTADRGVDLAGTTPAEARRRLAAWFPEIGVRAHLERATR